MKARISKKEELRRKRISKGMKRYWRKVRAVAKEEGISIREARKRLAEKVVKKIKIPTIPTIPEGRRYAFYMLAHLRYKRKEYFIKYQTAAEKKKEDALKKLAGETGE
ncbi:unnamed protein product [marine sediment metagenome]|uniref:Uncharacterized protein n=1 Tax=marine sediment metagenome TaxID=412755 RepID=X1S3A4_9ZZZZ